MLIVIQVPTSTHFPYTTLFRSMLKSRGGSLEGKRCVVSGAGNVAIYTMEKLRAFGGKVIACSDSNGYVVDEEGIDLDRKSTRLNSSHVKISYAVFCLKKKKCVK